MGMRNMDENSKAPVSKVEDVGVPVETMCSAFRIKHCYDAQVPSLKRKLWNILRIQNRVSPFTGEAVVFAFPCKKYPVGTKGNLSSSRLEEIGMKKVWEWGGFHERTICAYARNFQIPLTQDVIDEFKSEEEWFLLQEKEGRKFDLESYIV